MSADLLREAAALMRERAEAATPGGPRWETAVHDLHPSHRFIFPADSDSVITSAPADDAAHIASWHPAVALAVADLLDNEANLIASVDEYAHLHMPLNGARVDLLLTVARAYLGSDS